MRTERGDGRCYAFKRKTGSSCYRAVCARREKRCYVPTNETHAPAATGMVKWSVVPPIFCAETKDSKTNCSAASMSSILYKYNVSAILFRALPPFLWYMYQTEPH